MHHIFLLFPTYAFPKALDDLWVNNLFDNVHTFSLEQPGVGLHVIYMCSTAIFYFTVVLLIDENFFAALCATKVRFLWLFGILAKCVRVLGSWLEALVRGPGKGSWGPGSHFARMPGNSPF